MARVVFLHPDLGIGGAERLVVDAALALQAKGHQVTILTAHHDPRHCFRETVDGQLNVVAVGDWLPRSVLGRCQALFASIRMIYITLYMLAALPVDVVFLDQVSTPLLILSMTSLPTLFYCHFPDLLLSQGRQGMKGLYRLPLDYLEEVTTGMADMIFVNSGFTKQVFRSTFRRLGKIDPRILYPSLSTSVFDQTGQPPAGLPDLPANTTLLLSINRFERKKNLELAVFSLTQLNDNERASCHLLLAGGYDPRVQENVDYYAELDKLVRSLDLDHMVTLLRSPSDAEKVWLLRRADCLIYTPTGEHFGIVPLEAMYCGTPVLAVDSGGPRETVVDGVTGWLREPTSEVFGSALSDLLRHKDQLGLVSEAGRRRVQDCFSFPAFAASLDAGLLEVVQTKQLQLAGGSGFGWLTGLAVAFHFCLAMCVLFYMTFGTPLP